MVGENRSIAWLAIFFLQEVSIGFLLLVFAVCRLWHLKCKALMRNESDDPNGTEVSELPLFGWVIPSNTSWAFPGAVFTPSWLKNSCPSVVFLSILLQPRNHPRNQQLTTGGVEGLGEPLLESSPLAELKRWWSHWETPLETTESRSVGVERDGGSEPALLSNKRSSCKLSSWSITEEVRREGLLPA